MVLTIFLIFRFLYRTDDKDLVFGFVNFFFTFYGLWKLSFWSNFSKICTGYWPICLHELKRRYKFRTVPVSIRIWPRNLNGRSVGWSLNNRMLNGTMSHLRQNRRRTHRVWLVESSRLNRHRLTDETGTDQTVASIDWKMPFSIGWELFYGSKKL